MLKKVTEAKKQSEIAAKREEVEIAIGTVLMENKGNSLKVTISAVVEEIKKNYSSSKEKESIRGEPIGEENEDKFPGRIIYSPPSTNFEENIIIEIGEKLNIIEATTGEGGGTTGGLKETSEYTKVGGVYCNSPELSGFNPQITYYVTYNEDGTIKNESRKISEKAPNDWYDYSKKEWANIVTKNNGNITYWTWIPRFVYKTPKDDSTIPAQTTDVKFVTTDNKYYEDVGAEKQKEIQLDEKYKLSDAFVFNGKQLSGYWVSKYRVQAGTDDETATSTATVANIEVDLSGFNPQVTYYVTYNADGTIKDESKKISEKVPKDWYDYSKKEWANVVTKNDGNVTYWTYIPRYEYQNWKHIQQTSVRFIKNTTTNPSNGAKIPDSFTFNGVPLKGYWVSKYRVQEGTNDKTAEAAKTTTSNIEIDLSGFNPQVTYYVTYNADGTIKNESKKISEEAPDDWYDYSKKEWANVVTKGKDSKEKDSKGKELKTYWTYIPRYEYQAWKYTPLTNIRFIKSTTTNPSNNYFKIPDSFEFNGEPLKGYWVSKYRVQEGTTNTDFAGNYYKK